MSFLPELMYVAKDAFIFAAICLLILIIIPCPIRQLKYHFAIYLATFIFLLSCAMMFYSRKYSPNPISNKSRNTPWTWWRETFDNIVHEGNFRVSDITCPANPEGPEGPEGHSY